MRHRQPIRLGRPRQNPADRYSAIPVNSVIVRPSGFHLVTGSPLKEPHLDSTETDRSSRKLRLARHRSAYSQRRHEAEERDRLNNSPVSHVRANVQRSAPAFNS